MSEATLWLIYLSATMPGFGLRRWAGLPVWLCCLLAGIWSLTAVIVLSGSDADWSGKWGAVGLWVAFWFGAIAGLGGAGAAIWRE